MRGVPVRRGEAGGDGDVAAGVPARVPPALHRPVAAPARPLDVPDLPERRLAAAGANGVTFSSFRSVPDY